MSATPIAQPDITLLLDADGVIKSAHLSKLVSRENVEPWLGRRWEDTVGDVGAEKVRRMIQDARSVGVSAFRQVTQLMPSGLEVPIEFTTVRLGPRSGFMAVGKSLRAVAELQSRLVVAQQTMERDYWKLRQVETRYRQLFEASDEPVLLLNASTLRVAEANPAAIPLFSQSSRKREGLTGRDILPTLSSQERTALIAMLRVVREQGKSPAMIVRLGREPKSWMVSASLIKGDAGAQFLLRLAAVAGTTKEDAVNPPFSFEDVIERFPDGFVIIDADGVIRRANQAFLDLIECGSKASVQGERLGRWLWTPGADLAALIANVRRHGTVRLYSTIIHGELGAETAVEVSAAGIGPGKAQVVGVLLSNVSRRVSSHTISNNLLSALGPITDQVGRTSLRTLVDETTSVVERHYVKAALDLARGNRTAAAEILGLSRQSLYAKLNRYDLEKEPLTSPLDKDD